MILEVWRCHIRRAMLRSWAVMITEWPVITLPVTSVSSAALLPDWRPAITATRRWTGQPSSPTSWDTSNRWRCQSHSSQPSISATRA